MTKRTPKPSFRRIDYAALVRQYGGPPQREITYQFGKRIFYGPRPIDRFAEQNA